MRDDDWGDVSQAVFGTVFRRINDFRYGPTDTLRGWLWTITRSRIIDLHRGRDKQDLGHGSTSFLEQLQQYAEQEPELDDAVANPRLERIRNAIMLVRNDFQKKTWTAFWELAVIDRPAEDVAQDLGISRFTAYKHKSRVLRRLREELGLLDD